MRCAFGPKFIGQIQLRKFKVHFQKISHVFISHLHGDHYFGLPGLITTMNRKGRTKPLNLFGPRGIKEILTTMFKHGKSWTSFDLKIKEIDKEEDEIYSENHLKVETFKLDHRISCNAFKFTIKYSDLYTVSSKNDQKCFLKY